MAKLGTFGDFAAEIKVKIGEAYPDCTVSVETQKKVNKEVTALTVRKDGEAISPSINLTQMWEKNLTIEDAIKFIKDIKDSVVPPEVDFTLDKVVYQLINTKSNEDFLEGVPHRKVCDMSLIYRLIVDINSDGVQSIVVTYDLMDELKASEDSLYAAAKVNTPKMFPAKVLSMTDILKEMWGELPEELAEEEVTPMYVISNEMGMYGASVILYKGILKDLADKIGVESLVVIPSSLHEAIAIPVDGTDKDELNQMVEQVNSGSLDEAERLSNSVYLFKDNKLEVYVASDKGVKDIDYVA